MNASWKKQWPLALVGVVAVAAIIALTCFQPARAERNDAPATAGPRYDVVDTEAHNLIVTDNKSNKLYFYTIDKGKEVGSDLKIRGSVDLNQVGQPEIKLQKP